MEEEDFWPKKRHQLMNYWWTGFFFTNVQALKLFSSFIFITIRIEFNIRNRTAAVTEFDVAIFSLQHQKETQTK